MRESNPTKNRLSSSRILGGMQIRKKLIVIHTVFSLCLGVVLILAIRPAMSKVIYSADIDHAELLIELFMESDSLLTQTDQLDLNAVRIDIGTEVELGISETISFEARQASDSGLLLPSDNFAAGILKYLPETDTFLLVRARSINAREKIKLVYTLVILTLLAGYMLVAITLEVFILPEHVYRPIRSILAADQAVRDGDKSAEIVPENVIPADELGLIMRSRNKSILALRTHEKDLARALDRLEHAAADLHKKNHLLETARKNLQGADRLASLGMMSAGIAHELNTPLAVVTGLVEKLNRDQELSPTEIALLSRVVSRLEKLSDGLLDFARVRPPLNKLVDISRLVEEALTLVMIDKAIDINRFNINVLNQIESGTMITCDPSKIVQVFVNLVRNAVDELVNTQVLDGKIKISSVQESRDGSDWIILRIQDNGSGINADVIDRLFEPFVSTRLDSHGTGLGLAVTNGIIREHGGVLVATNRPADEEQTGAIFEVTLPIQGVTESQYTAYPSDGTLS